MTLAAESASQPLVIDRAGLEALLAALIGRGYRVIGPRRETTAVTLGDIHFLDDLAIGVVDEQAPGYYRVAAAVDGTLFAANAPAHPWKRYLYPSAELLWRARRDGSGFAVEEASPAMTQMALFGVRACDVAAIDRLDHVFERGQDGRSRYRARRAAAFVVAMACSRSGETCFCASMGTGPDVRYHHDLALTEFGDGGERQFLVDIGSERGRDVMAGVPAREATAADCAAARGAVAEAARNQSRHMIDDVAEVLKDNLEHRRWNAVGERCLGCANCTMSCPTCFCSAVEDTTDLGGTVAERWRRWDSCFTLDFSYLHGGSVRRSAAARYRQWITHKLSTWKEQFGTSGCVGCGRCITWCPVGIDITDEARRIRDGEGYIAS